jgi:hypothetical protein
MSFDFLNDPLDELEEAILDEACKTGELKFRTLDEILNDNLEIS